MTFRVWSERESNPAAPGWHDCWVSNRLAELAAAGYDFGARAFTDAEREAAERAQTLVAPETGSGWPPPASGDAFLARRYGVVDHHATDLAALLSVPGLAIALYGHNSNLVTRLRHWDPAFTGYHAATVITLAPAGLLWLDPEAPMGYAGEPISASELLTWWDRGAVRYLAVGELAVTIITRTPISPARSVRFAGPLTYHGYDPITLASSGVVTIAAGGSSALADASATIAPPPAWAPGGTVLHIANGALAGRYVPTAGLTLAPAPPPPAPDCTVAVGQAVTARDLAWRAALVAVHP